MVKSRFSFTVYFLTLFLSGLFAGGIFFLSHPGMELMNGGGDTNGAAFPGIIMFAISVLLFILIAKRIFVLRVYPDQLVIYTRFARSILPRAEISRIQLLGRGTVLNNPADVLVIETTAGQSFALPDQYCRNMPECKMALLDGYREFVVDAPAPRSAVNLPARGEDEEFCGNHVLSVNGALLYGITGFYLWLLAKLLGSAKGLLSLGMLIPLLALGFAFGSQLFYFRISGDMLEIRNHIFRWYTKEYPLPDVAQVVFEQVRKQSRALRVRTVDFRSRSFSAGSLRNRHWIALASALKERGIPVKNELILGGLPLTGDQ